MTAVAAPPDRDAGVETSTASRWGVVFAVVFLAAPLLLERPSIVVPPGLVGMHLAKSLEALAVLALGIWLVRQRTLPHLAVPVLLTVLFISEAGISGLWAPDAAWFRVHYAKFFHHAVTAVVLFVAIRNRRQLEYAVCGLHAVAVIMALLIMVEVAAPGFRVDRLLVGSGIKQVNLEIFNGIIGAHYRAKGPLGHSNFLGFFFGAALLLQPYVWARFPTRRARALLVVVTLVELWALVLGYVRLGMLGLACGSLWLLVRGAVRHRLLIILGLVIAVPITTPFLPEGWLQRTLDPTHLQHSSSIEYRTYLLEESLRLAKRYGVWGVGYSGFGGTYHREASAAAVATSIAEAGFYGQVYNPNNLGAHNTYLEVIIEQGIPGIVLFLAIGVLLFGGLFVNGGRNRGDPAARQLGLCLEAMLVSVSVMYGALHAQDQRIPWAVVGLGSAYVVLTRSGAMRAAPEPLVRPMTLRVGVAVLLGSMALLAAVSPAKWLAGVFAVALIGALLLLGRAERVRAPA